MRRLAGLAALVAAVVVATPAQAAPTLVKAGDFVAPTYVAGSPGDSHRLFVVEQRGQVQVLVDGRPKTFLDIAGDTLSGGERGLLSIAFPPDYQTSRRFYVYLTARQPLGQIQVREYLRSATDLDRADPASGRTILAISHSDFANHNGGQLQFGPDGRLWVGTGDGGGGNDALHNSQNPLSQLGKLLRLDPVSGAAAETFALGLRNPWRFSFDRLTHDLVIGDVGQGAVEEVDFAPAPTWNAGADYGWPCWEGTRDNSGDTTEPRCGTPFAHVDPVLEREHGATVCSLTGGYVVRDPGLTSLRGRYLYGDLCDSHLRSAALPSQASDRQEDLAVARVTSFGEDVCGRVYVASNDGPVSRIQDGAATPCDITPPAPVVPGAPTPPGGVADTTRPSLKVTVAGRRTLATRRRLRIGLRANEAVAATLGGRLRGVGRFKAASRSLAAGKRKVVVLRISRTTARTLRRTLRRHRGRATLTARARDAAGNRRTVTRRVTLPRKR